MIWPLLIGPVRAKHYLMTGAFVSAEQAASMGMINEVVSDRDVREFAIEYAEMLASGPRDAINWTKYSVNKIVKEFTAPSARYVGRARDHYFRDAGAPRGGSRVR